jgi:hypothetical protein
MFYDMERCPMPLDPVVPEENANYLSYSDLDLVRACLEGSQLAWNELVERYGRLIYSICRHYQLSPAQADTLFLRVFTVAFHQLANLQYQASLSSWLITTTYDECHLFVRLPPPSAEKIQRWQIQHAIYQARRRA